MNEFLLTLFLEGYDMQIDMVKGKVRITLRKAFEDGTICGDSIITPQRILRQNIPNHLENLVKLLKIGINTEYNDWYSKRNTGSND